MPEFAPVTSAFWFFSGFSGSGERLMICKMRAAKSFSCAAKASALIVGNSFAQRHGISLFHRGFQHDLKMRLAAEIQGDEASQQNHYRGAMDAPHQSHENSSDSSSRPDEISQHLARAAQATNDAVRVWTVATGALSWPQGLDSLLGYTPSPSTDEIGFWQKQLHPQDRARAAASIRDALAADGNHWTGEYRFRHLDGSYLDLLERAYIVRDRLGRPVQWIGSLMNITARKQLQDQLCRSQKMEAFGQLAGGVAHDFNNFLTTIFGYSDLLLEERHIKGTLADHVTEIRAAAGRASVLTQQLLAFSRRQPREPIIVEINSVIANLERSLLRLIGENISVVCHLHHEKEGAHIKADPNQISQIILNLAVNARDAMPEGGQLAIETSVCDLDTETFSCGESGAGKFVIINIADTGVGMNDEVKAHLFEPF